MDLGRVRVGVVGGGVGGLAAGIACAQLGADVRVFERAHRRRHEGVALLIWSNAMRALHKLGVAEVIRPRSASIETTELRTPDGQLLGDLPIGEWSRSAEMPTVAVRRPDLIAALTHAVGPERIRVGAALTSFEIHDHGVVARFADEDPIELDMLIGADGLNSTVRAQLFGSSPPRSNQQHAWVGITRNVGHLVRSGLTTVTIGRGPRFWYAPLDAGDVFWYATLHDRPGSGDDVVTELAQPFAGWHSPIGDILAATRNEDVVYTQIFDRPPMDQWGRGPVTLLGDAAHASTPDLGQGACQALESAVVLANSLQRAGNVTDGLRAYEALRRDRTATISRLCWLASLNATARNPAVCTVRDAVLRVGLRSLARGPLTWIMAGQEC